jgi:hypothetical protein
VEELLHQERSACEQAETQLQQEQAALEDTRASIQRERSMQEEAQGQLQQESFSLTEVRAALQLRESEIERLTGELVQESEDLWIANKEKDASVLKLRQEAETARADLGKEKKQV